MDSAKVHVSVWESAPPSGLQDLVGLKAHQLEQLWYEGCVCAYYPFPFLQLVAPYYISATHCTIHNIVASIADDMPRIALMWFLLMRPH